MAAKCWQGVSTSGHRAVRKKLRKSQRAPKAGWGWERLGGTPGLGGKPKLPGFLSTAKNKQWGRARHERSCCSPPAPGLAAAGHRGGCTGGEKTRVYQAPEKADGLGNTEPSSSEGLRPPSRGGAEAGWVLGSSHDAPGLEAQCTAPRGAVPAPDVLPWLQMCVPVSLPWLQMCCLGPRCACPRCCPGSRCAHPQCCPGSRCRGLALGVHAYPAAPRQT